MAENAHIRVRTGYSSNQAYFDQIQEYLKKMSISDPVGVNVNADSKTIKFTDPGYQSATVFTNATMGGPSEFDPSRIDWDQLMELYGDDPALTFIFGQLKEHFLSPGHRFQFRDHGSTTAPVSPGTVGTGTSTWPLTYTSTTDTNVSVSDPVTVTYDSSGVINVVSTKS